MFNRRSNSLSSSAIAGLIIVALLLIGGTIMLYTLGTPPSVPSVVGASPGPSASPGSETNGGIFLPGLFLMASFLVLVIFLVSALLARLFGRRRRRYRQVGLLARGQADFERRAREAERRAREAALEDELAAAAARGGGRRRLRIPGAAHFPLLARALGLLLLPFVVVIRAVMVILNILGWPLRQLERLVDRVTRGPEHEGPRLAKSSSDRPLEPVVFERPEVSPEAPSASSIPSMASEPAVWRGPRLGGGADSGGFQRPRPRSASRSPRFSLSGLLRRRPAARPAAPAPSTSASRRPAVITAPTRGSGPATAWSPQPRPGFLGWRRRPRPAEIEAVKDLGETVRKTGLRRLGGGEEQPRRPSPVLLLLRSVGHALRAIPSIPVRGFRSARAGLTLLFAGAVLPRLTAMGAWLAALPVRIAEAWLRAFDALMAAATNALRRLRSGILALLRVIRTAVRAVIARAWRGIRSLAASLLAGVYFLAALPGRTARALRAAALRTAAAGMAFARAVAAVPGHVARWTRSAAGSIRRTLIRLRIALLRLARLVGRLLRLTAATLRRGLRFLAELPGRTARYLGDRLVASWHLLGRAAAGLYRLLRLLVRPVAFILRTVWGVLRTLPRQMILEILLIMTLGGLVGLGALAVIYQGSIPGPVETPAPTASATIEPTPTPTPAPSVSFLPGDEFTARRAALPSCPEGGSCGLYTIAPGDSFNRIAAYFGVPAGDLAAANPGIDPSRLTAGDAMRIPR